MIAHHGSNSHSFGLGAGYDNETGWRVTTRHDGLRARERGPAPKTPLFPVRVLMKNGKWVHPAKQVQRPKP
jgi:hypothetical protein